MGARSRGVSDCAYEARLAAALSAQEAACDDEAMARREAKASRLAMEEAQSALEALVAAGGSLPASVRGGGTPAATLVPTPPSADSPAPPPVMHDKPPIPQQPQPPAGGARRSKEEFEQNVESWGGVADALEMGPKKATRASKESLEDDEEEEKGGGGPAAISMIAGLMSLDDMNQLLKRTQRQLMEVSALAEFEYKMLLGEAPPQNMGGGATTTDLRPPKVEVSLNGTTAPPPGMIHVPQPSKVVAGPASRIAWLLREGVGSVTPMSIKSHVKPATRPMDHTQLRKALRSLFSQQKVLSTQSAIGNWELLTAMVYCGQSSCIYRRFTM